MGLLLVKAQLLDNPAHGVVVGEEAEADDLGVEPLELGHGSARVECIVQVGVLMIGLLSGAGDGRGAPATPATTFLPSPHNFCSR